MESITLQTSDSSVVVNDILGRLGFAASSESDGGDSVLVAAMIKAVAEETFGANANRTSIVFSTANSAIALDRLKITSDGHFIPFASGTQDLGSPSKHFRNIYADNIIGDYSGQLDGDLDLNNHDIIGTGNITIDGNITAEYFYGDLDGVVVTECRNGTASTISEGTPVYVSGYYSSNGKPLIAEANASSSSTMPAIGLLASDLASGAEGHVHVFGLAQNLPSGVTNGFSVGETVYVAAGGGLTNVRPTGVSELVQNMGRVLKTGTNGRILVLGPGRSNDVPNSGHFEQLTVDGQTILAKDGGNVGIGTTNPGAFSSSFNQLVVGNGSNYQGSTIYSAVQGTLAFGDTATSTQDGYRGYLAYIHSNDYMVIGTSGAERIRIASDGKVGIGDSSPNTKLHVAGAITTDSYIVFGDPANGYITGNVTDTLTYQGDSHRFWNEAKTTEYANFNTASVVFNDGGLNRDFRVEGYGNPNVLFVDASEDNVGIGTATPSPAGGGTSLHIHDTNYPEIKLTNDNTGSASGDGSVIQVVNSDLRFTNREDGNSISFYAFDTGGTSRQKLILSESLIAVNGAKTNTDFQVKGEVDDDLIRTDANTNRVGIGTATPQAKLDVNGTVEFDDLVKWEYPDKQLDSNRSDFGYLRFYDETNGIAGVGISTTSFNIGTSGAINFRVITDSTERIIVGSNGNTVVNEEGHAVNFRVEGDADENLLIARGAGGVDKVGIGCSPSLGKLHIQSLYTNNNGHGAIYIDQRNTSSSNGTYNNAGIDLLSRKLVNSGVTDTGQIVGADLVAVLDGDGSLNNSYGARTWGGIYINNSGSLTNAWGIHPRVINGGYNGASIANAYGVDIVIDGDLYDRIDGNTITTAMSLRIRGIEHAANKWAIYQEGVNDDNYFAGKVGIGTATPSYNLDVNGTFSANSINVNDEYTFPTTDGSTNQILATNGNGVVTWQNQLGTSATTDSHYAMIHVFG